MRRATASEKAATALAVAILDCSYVDASLPSRDRVVQSRLDAGLYSRYRDNGLPIDGNNYRSFAGRQDLLWDDSVHEERSRIAEKKQAMSFAKSKEITSTNGIDRVPNYHIGEEYSSEEDALRAFPFGRTGPASVRNADSLGESNMIDYGQKAIQRNLLNDQEHRELGSVLTGCCSTYSSYNASDLCYMYGQDCESGNTPSHDNGQRECSLEGLSFIGVSFSVNTAYGNQYSYQLNDQFPMEHLIDRNYDYVMSMDEDGWLVGGGYKQFDYSGKMPYIDSGHTELLRVGSMDVNRG